MMKRVHETAESHAKLIKSKFDESLAYSSHSLADLKRKELLYF